MIQCRAGPQSWVSAMGVECKRDENGQGMGRKMYLTDLNKTK